MAIVIYDYLSKAGVTLLWSRAKDYFVKKETGKGLSSNDYTTAEKDKLSQISDKAQVNEIEVIRVNGTEASKSNKVVDITVPTNNNQLTNGAGYQTAEQVTAAINSAVPTNNNQLVNGAGYLNESQVNALISAGISDITGFEFQPVTELPSTGEKGIIYLLSNNGVTPNAYDEYIWVNNKFELIGSTSVDLSGYVKSEQLVAITTEEIDSICQ